MPNYCTAKIVIKGYKDNVDDFVKCLRADYNYGTMEFSHRKHFYRIFEVYDLDEEINGLEKTKNVEITCAWSVYSCMFDGPFTYYSDCTMMPDKGDIIKSYMPFNDRDDIDKVKEYAAWHIIHSTHIMAETKRLGLFVEIISEEPGMGFQEHYVINQSVLVKNEESDFAEYYIGDNETKKDWEDDYGFEIPLSDEEYKDLRDKGEDVYVPYRVEFDENSSINKNVNPAKNVMCKVVDNSKEFIPWYERKRK